MLSKKMVKLMSRRILSFILTLVLLSGISAIPVTADTINPDTVPEFVSSLGDLSGKVVIIHTNDTHGADVAVAGTSIGTAGITQLFKDYEAAGAQVLLFSAGDAIQGDPIVSLDKGKSAIEFMNLAGYDMLNPGNHEFDYGYDNFLELSEAADFPVISSNIVDRASGKCIFDDSIIFESKAGSIGVFGLTTPETLTGTNPSNIASLSFISGEAMYDVAQQQVDKLKAAGADYIICVAHLGIDDGSKPNRSVDVAENVDGIDIIIDGHSHSVIDGDKYEGTVVVSTGTKLSYAGVIILDEDGIETRLISAAEYNRTDPAVNEVINKAAGEIDALLSEAFAVTEVFLDGNRDPGVRTLETNLGDFAADAILWEANRSITGGVDAAITNGGGIRASINIGDVTMKDMKTVFPYGNTISIVKITGAQLIEVLEASTFCTPIALGGFPQISGMELTINTGVPYSQGEQYPDSTFYAPAKPGSRILNVKVNGEPIDPDRTYTIATNDFLAEGGDTYYLFRELGSYSISTALEDALIDYTNEVLNGVITKEMYGEPAGRINILNEPAAEADLSEADESSADTSDEDKSTEELPVTEGEADKSSEEISVKDKTSKTDDSDKATDADYTVRTYTVVKGDCLWKIARKFLGKGSKYTLIYELNKDIIKNPNVIYIGQKLKIPA